MQKLIECLVNNHLLDYLIVLLRENKRERE